MDAVRIRVDVHEQASGIPEILASFGACIELGHLAAGDYEVGPGVLIERKTVLDFHASLVQGRFWRQVRNVRSCGTWPLLLVEGNRLTDDAVRGACLAAIEQGVAVLRSEDRVDSARWLMRLSHRVHRRQHRYRPRFAQIPKSPRDELPVSVLAAVPSISSPSESHSEGPGPST